MTKISKKLAYPLKDPVLKDYFVGTDSENNGKTVNFDFEATARIISELNGNQVVKYRFRTDSNIDLTVLTEGVFLSSENETTIESLSKIYINKSNFQETDISDLFRFVALNKEVFLIKLRNENNLNNAVYLKITGATEYETHFILDVSAYLSNTSVPELINYNIYFFDFELISSGEALDLSSLENRITVLENQTDTDNVFVEMQNFSFEANILNISSGWIWKIAGVSYSNVANVTFPVTFCAAGKTRLEYFVPNNANGFTRISGEETLGIAQAPQLPVHGLYVTYFLVTDSGIGTPQNPNTDKIPNIDEVLGVGYSTTNPIWFFNSQNSKCIGLTSERILFQKNESIFNELRADNTTESYNTQLPNKTGGQEETIAMLSDLEAKLDIADYNDRFKGVYLTESALNIAYPTANSGDSAQVNEVGTTDVVNYSWDAEENIWVKNGSTSSGATNTDLLPEGTSNLYFNTARVLATLLSGFSLVTGGSIVSTDSVLTAFGKLQKQINDAVVSIALKANLASPTFTGVPSVPTATAGTNTNQIASTAFVTTATSEISSKWTRDGTLIYPVNFTTEKIGIGVNSEGLGTRLTVKAISGQTGIANFYDNAGGLISSINSGGFNSTVLSASIYAIAPYFAPSYGGGLIGPSAVSWIKILSDNTWELRGRADYIADYSSSYVDRSIVDKGFVDKNRMKPFTVATLPTSPTQGDSYVVTDALAPAYLVTVVGGGTVVTPVFFNGTNWVAH